ncbi:hemagglutinin [Neisseria arctica]|uniref:Hemagglutinin n=2 Tax=Neisseria arctica TaxID=1470200 RepID=A0A0J1C4H8_9NEIS|nr:hemagglutinin [Neisseria arctica]
MRQDVSRTSNKTFNYIYNTEKAKDRLVHYMNTIDNRADFFAASNQYEKNLGVGAKWFEGAEKVSRNCITGLGADGCGSYITFGAGKILSNPDIYSWRKEAGDTLITQGFNNFKYLYNNRPNPIQWDIKQLKDEQRVLQPIHDKYLANKQLFRKVSEIVSGVNILDYKSRIQYGCNLLGYTEKQGCKS